VELRLAQTFKNRKALADSDNFSLKLRNFFLNVVVVEELDCHRS
jgi:hypothetical protein